MVIDGYIGAGIVVRHSVDILEIGVQKENIEKG
jgi:hypothetical protein